VAALNQLKERMPFLASRAGAVKTSLENLLREQRREGLSLRQDVMASWKRMEHFMDKADEALEAKDAVAAGRFMEQAEREVEKLERFLGK